MSCVAYIKPENCTSEVLTPMVADMKSVFAAAIVEVQALAGQSGDVILGVDVTVSVLAELVGDLLVVSTAKYTCIRFELTIVSSSSSSLLSVLFLMSLLTSPSTSSCLSSVLLGQSFSWSLSVGC